MLLAADILSQNGHSSTYERDIIFTALSGEAFDLMASRKLLYDLQHKEEDPRAASNLEGLDFDRVHTIVELGMLGFDADAFNGTGGSGGDLYVHSSTIDQSPAATALINNAAAGSLNVRPLHEMPHCAVTASECENVDIHGLCHCHLFSCRHRRRSRSCTSEVALFRCFEGP
jgi:Nicastrin